MEQLAQMVAWTAQSWGTSGWMAGAQNPGPDTRGVPESDGGDSCDRSSGWDSG